MIESNLGGVIVRVDSGLASTILTQQQAQNGNANNGAHLGLITTPSPRSLSVDSSKVLHRRRGRSRSRVADDSDVDSSSALYSSFRAPSSLTFHGSWSSGLEGSLDDINRSPVL